MANLLLKDGAGNSKYLSMTGAGTDEDPHVPQQVVALSGDLPDTAAGDLAAIVAALGGTLTVDGSGVTQPVSASALPLPSGAATAANQASILAKLSADPATQTTLAALLTELQAKADLSETQPVSAASLPLPSGAATEATLADVKTAVELIDDAISGSEMQVDVVGALPAGEAHVGEVGGKTVTPSGSVTRPADTTAYTAGDAVSDSTSAPTAASVSGCARVNGGSGVILRAILIDSANQSTAGDFEVYLFSEAHTATNDNAAWAPSDADIESYYIGKIDFGDTPDVLNAASGASGNCAYDSEQIAVPFKCGAGSTSLYWQLVARNAYTPVSAEKFTLRLSIAQD